MGFPPGVLLVKLEVTLYFTLVSTEPLDDMYIRERRSRHVDNHLVVFQSKTSTLLPRPTQIRKKMQTGVQMFDRERCGVLSCRRI
ncbi:hypothetical protein EDD22DRAFT_217130 [Suillus occidentalis]|nr:hypothetical protein EDD22DRAFT_217130 [Suillus occidentalis]